MKLQKERNINFKKSNLNEVSKRKKYKSTHKLRVKKQFLLKKKNIYKEEIENNSCGEEIKRIKSNIYIYAKLAKIVKKKTKDNNN